ncbi:hypothetical protein A7E78_03805 [Syntrophotalea acetylenivorans]|uniref:MPN domain-containing protein n=1 Tax=Syntrophotalea acetylenivorans TaxID=1842532 RepID=A0A1L3GM82_9BACT|nr:Mov34/MPN/PAD-1 family protein [Syntrophotalea acetylenivorans]APG27032.1 hypothetical protein A7E78_03805 [Syntrophotalea acetylenivorans]
MKWNNVRSDIRALSLGSIASNWSAFDVLELLNFTQHEPIVLFGGLVRKAISEHLSTKNVELGGLLLGNVISNKDLIDGIVAIKITQAVPSQTFKSSCVSLSMDANVWQDANIHGDATNFVVGWYHSHPNLGAFFSGTDRSTQKNFFTNSYSLGLVVDPIRKEERWFRGSESVELSADNILRTIDGLALV